MKKILSIVALVLSLGLGSMLHSGSAAAVTKDGSDFQNGSRVGLGNYPGASAYIALPMTAQIAITKGMAVKYNTDASAWYNTVSPTSAVGDQTFMGIAMSTVAAGDTLWVAISGIVPAKYPAGTTTTVGVAWTAVAAGALTPTAVVSGTTNTARSLSVVVPLETKAVNADGLVRSLILF